MECEHKKTYPKLAIQGGFTRHFTDEEGKTDTKLCQKFVLEIRCKDCDYHVSTVVRWAEE